MTEHIQVIHHHSLDLISDVEGWMAAHMRIAEKWDGRLSPSQTVPGDWKERARWAEARRDAALMQANQAYLEQHAAAVEFDRQRESVERSASWRLTKPLRWLKSRFGRGGDGQLSVNGGAPPPSWSADQK
jgi:hypothetical protein